MMLHFFIGICFSLGSGKEKSILYIIYSTIQFGLICGIIISLFYSNKARHLNLPDWDSYGN
jgi:lipoprotein signal peptidase